MDALRRYAGGDAGRDPRTDRCWRAIASRASCACGASRRTPTPRCPPADRAAFAAYARGVNHFIATHLNNLPVEFTLLDYQPRPWSVVDSPADLPAHVPQPHHHVEGRNAQAQHAGAGRPRQGGVPVPHATGWRTRSPGSNAWAIAGSHTASGKPLLSNDMHLEYSLPGIWYMTHLEAPGLDVAGVALPGAPGIIVGHNQRIAWGITNLQLRRAGPVHREVRRTHRPLPVPRPGGAGARSSARSSA